MIDLYSGGHTETEFQGQCQDQRTLTISCINGDILRCPVDRLADNALNIQGSNRFVDYTVPQAEFHEANHSVTVKVELDPATDAFGTPETWKNGNTEYPMVGSPLSLNMAGGGTIYRFTYTACDGQGNCASCINRVEVKDSEPPTIENCPAPHPVTLEKGKNFAYIAYDLPNASDNVQVQKGTISHDTSMTFTANESGSDVNCWPAVGEKIEDEDHLIVKPLQIKGTTDKVVTCVAYDTSGNKANCAFTITRMIWNARVLETPAQAT